MARGAAARVALQVACSADKRTGARISTGGETPRRNSTALESTGSQGSQFNTRSTRWMPAGASTSPTGTATTYLAAEVQSSSPRRPRDDASVRNQLNSSHNFIPATSSRDLTRAGKTAQTTPKPALAITLQPMSHRRRVARDHVSGRVDRPSTTPPVGISILDDAARREQLLTKTLLPLRLANVSGFSCEAERSEVSSAASRSYAAAVPTGPGTTVLVLRGAAYSRYAHRLTRRLC